MYKFTLKDIPIGSIVRLEDYNTYWIGEVLEHAPDLLGVRTQHLSSNEKYPITTGTIVYYQVPHITHILYKPE